MTQLALGYKFRVGVSIIALGYKYTQWLLCEIPAWNIKIETELYWFIGYGVKIAI